MRCPAAQLLHNISVAIGGIYPLWLGLMICVMGCMAQLRIFCIHCNSMDFNLYLVKFYVLLMIICSEFYTCCRSSCCKTRFFCFPSKLNITSVSVYTTNRINFSQQQLQHQQFTVDHYSFLMSQKSSCFAATWDLAPCPHSHWESLNVYFAMFCWICLVLQQPKI